MLGVGCWYVYAASRFVTSAYANFTGTAASARVIRTDALASNFGLELSFCCWAKAGNFTAGRRGLLTAGDPGTGSVQFYIEPGRMLNATISGGGGESVPVPVFASIVGDEKTWHHYCVVVETIPPIVTLYRDGSVLYRGAWIQGGGRGAPSRLPPFAGLDSTTNVPISIGNGWEGGLGMMSSEQACNACSRGWTRAR